MYPWRHGHSYRSYATVVNTNSSENIVNGCVLMLSSYTWNGFTGGNIVVMSSTAYG